jgi:hypothetical protein
VVAAFAIGIAVAGMVAAGGVVLAWTFKAVGRRRARGRCTASCATPGSAVSYLGWSGSTSAFGFESPTYTARFAEHNTAKLVSVTPQLRQLLEAHEVARRQVPTPASAQRVVPPPLDTEGWRALLGREQRTIARRIALGRALETIRDPSARDVLVAAVCQAEIAALTTRLGAASPVVRRRRIREAIVEVRTDNLPPELAQAKLRELEALA